MSLLKYFPKCDWLNLWSRHWREFSISKNLVRISNENSRSITRNPFLFLVPFSKFKIWQSKFSISSRSTRYRRYKSRSRLEQRDYKNLDLISRKIRDFYSYFFAEIFCAIISKHQYCFFPLHMAYMLFIHISTTFTFTRLQEMQFWISHKR